MFLTKLSNSLGHGGDVSLLQNKVGVPPTNTLDRDEDKHDINLALNIGVEHTHNMLEVRWHYH